MEDGDGDAAVALVKTGEAMLTLGGANTYGGSTTVKAGIFEAKSTGALSHYTTSGSVVVNNGATLAVNVGGAGEWSNADISTLLYSVALTSGRGLGIDTTDGNFTLTNTISGSLGITKLGANTLTLTGTNSLTGGTELIGGVLSVSGVHCPWSRPNHPLRRNSSRFLGRTQRHRGRGTQPPVTWLRMEI